MCIIAVKKIGVDLPKEEVFRNCFLNNPDGAGFMYNSHGKVVIRKGFMRYSDFKYALENELKKIKDVKNTGMVFHFRITTQGGTRQENCHPFPISNVENDLRETNIRTPLGIAHNGIIDLTSGYNYGKYDAALKKYVRKDEHLSDTQLFIRDYLYDIYKLNHNFYKTEEGLELVEKLIDSKMAFLDGTGEIHTIGAFNECKGILYSNYTYASYYSTKRYSTYSPVYSYDDYDYYGYTSYPYSGTAKNDSKKESKTETEKPVESFLEDKSDKKSEEESLSYVRLMPIDTMAYFFGTSDEGTIDEEGVYGIDKTGLLYAIDIGSGTAFLESSCYVNVYDYNGNSIDYDDEKAEEFEDWTVYC